MYILAIDSATPVAGVALLHDERLIAEEFANVGLTHSETLMPMMDRILRSARISVAEVEALAVTIGPGSFTGLRIGLAAAKGLALAADKPLIGVSTLEVLAHNLSYTPYLIGTLLDARKGEVYAALYDVSEAYPQRLGDEMACSPQEFCRRAERWLDETGKPGLMLAGDGFGPYRRLWEEQLAPRMACLPPHQMLPRASALGSLAYRRAIRKDYSDRLLLRPTYIRLSEAQHRLGIGEL